MDPDDGPLPSIAYGLCSVPQVVTLSESPARVAAIRLASKSVTVQSQGVNDVPGHPRLRKALVLAKATKRAWRYLASVDADWRAKRHTAPFPLLRWLACVGILISTAPGSSSGVSPWWHAHAVELIIAAVVTIGPDITRIEFGGLKMELLRETRDELRGLGIQLNQLQVQQARAASQASVVNLFYEKAEEAEAAAKVIKETEKGEEAKRVSATEVDWGLFMRPVGAQFSGSPVPQQLVAPEAESSPGLGAGSTVST